MTKFITKGKGQGRKIIPIVRRPIMRVANKRYDLKNKLKTKKRYNIMYNIGKAKYVVNFSDGKSKHSDGSDFYDISIFHNKKDLNAFVTNLVSEGYTLRGYLD